MNRSSAVRDGGNVGIMGFGYITISATLPDSYERNKGLLGGRLSHPTIFKCLIAEGMEPFISLLWSGYRVIRKPALVRIDRSCPGSQAKTV